ncbi:MAG: Maf family protein [Planctomycetes bacterium]|nr:Maf family protein [Planctomycetota bacterium]
MRLILASASSARRELLRSAGFDFDVVAARVRELRGRCRPLCGTVLENARRKAAAVARRHRGRWVLAADTMIEFEGRLYGKPSGRGDGIGLLARMAGKTHTLATGIVLCRDRRAIERVVESRVTLRPLGRREIARIVRTPERFAGGYAVVGKDDPLVERIEGSFTNVVGLPMEVVAPLLEKRLRTQ